MTEIMCCHIYNWWFNLFILYFCSCFWLPCWHLCPHLDCAVPLNDGAALTSCRITERLSRTWTPVSLWPVEKRFNVQSFDGKLLHHCWPLQFFGSDRYRSVCVCVFLYNPTAADFFRPPLTHNASDDAHRFKLLADTWTTWLMDVNMTTTNKQ